MKIKSGLFFVFLFAVGVMPLCDALGKTCPEGEYLLTNVCRDCPPGCYCAKMTGDRYALDPKNKISQSELKDWCSRKKSSCDLPDKTSTYYEEYAAGCGRNSAAQVFRCPDDFPFSKELTFSEKGCYNTIGNKKIYYRVVSCDPGDYLPVNSAECVSCKTGAMDYCPGVTDKYPSMTENQGLETCGVGQKASSDHTRCESTSSGGNNGVTIMQGFASLKKPDFKNSDNQNGDVTGNNNENNNENNNDDDSDNQGTTVEIGAGYYLPANSTNANDKKRCANLGRDEYCPGGTFALKHSKRQGVEICSYSVSADHSACELRLTADQMKYGILGGKSGSKNNACWTLANPDKFKECIGIKEDFLDLIRGNSTDK